MPDRHLGQHTLNKIQGRVTHPPAQTSGAKTSTFYGYVLTDRLAVKPVPVKGRQRWFNVPHDVLRKERCLESTADAYAELDIDSLARLLELGIGREVPGAFPTRLSLRVLGDLLREGKWLSGLEPRLEPVPEMWGASSFLRALRAFGSALHDAGASTRQPFCVAREPHGLRSALFGNLFAMLPLNPAFAARRLDIGRGRFADYRRALGGLVLLALRVDCVRAQLAEASPLGARSYRQAFSKQIPAVFGFELPPAFAGALWVDDHAPRRFMTLLAAVAKSAELIQTHDEDWFRNPRAVEELRAELESAPPLEYPKEQLELGLELLLRTLNEASG